MALDAAVLVTLVGLGLAAGALTTWIGLGGGIVMTLVMSVLYGPEAALATAAPALWIGNLHRLLLYRRALDWPAVFGIGAPALLGAIGGGLIATALPARILQFLVVGATVVALVPRDRFPAVATGRLWSVPLGLLTGFVTATSGAGVVFLVPALLARGVEGERFLATAALISLVMHTGRLGAYAAGGWVDTDILRMAATVGLAIMIGNVLGRWLRHRSSERVLGYALRGMTVVIAGVAVASLA